MRVISGKCRGAKLMCIDSLDTRPTTDRIKEDLFNIINSKIYDSNVLDLFSGSGALGIECASRGANFSTLVENGTDAFNIINENIVHVKLQDKVKVVKEDVFYFLKKLGQKNQTFDIIFLDPPYLSSFEKKSLDLICEYNLLSDSGIIIIEHSTKTELELPINLLIFKQKKYKVTTLSFLRKC